MDSRGSHRTVRAKVKSGCRTCRIRKVKCDESHPVCQRCLSTGRVCDGYGIWGGGGNFYGHRQLLTSPKESLAVPLAAGSVSILTLDNEENGYFEWFKCRAATKLPGSFVSGFWNTLLFQASLNEPAVLHAVLTLSSVHKRGVINNEDQRKPKSIPDEQEQFSLQHYIKAINHLQPHFLVKDRASFRVALITCIVFVYLELLRGHFKTAETYLQNGLRILGEMQMLSSVESGSFCSKSCSKSTDEWIDEAFSRLHLQMVLFRHDHQHLYLFLQFKRPATPALVFNSVSAAWEQMRWLLNQIFHLNHQVREQMASKRESFQYPLAMFGNQQRIRTELAKWLAMYEVFMDFLQGHRSAEEEKCYQLLRIYHTMANIMADTCLRPGDELVFDVHTNQFVLLIRQLANLWTISSTTLPPAGPAQLVDMSRSIIDIGWIPPLYYAAVKCRIHRVRLQAIKLLESTSHREGVWDARTAACIARKVMEIEERDFYKDVEIADDFPLSSYPRSQDLSLPALPESYRISEVEVMLSGAPTDKIRLFCKRKQEGVDFRILLSEYNAYLERWIDGRCG